jgi:hypothetical protein
MRGAREIDERTRTYALRQHPILPLRNVETQGDTFVLRSRGRRAGAKFLSRQRGESDMRRDTAARVRLVAGHYALAHENISRRISDLLYFSVDESFSTVLLAICLKHNSGLHLDRFSYWYGFDVVRYGQ